MFEKISQMLTEKSANITHYFTIRAHGKVWRKSEKGKDSLFPFSRICREIPTDFYQISPQNGKMSQANWIIPFFKYSICKNCGRFCWNSNFEFKLFEAVKRFANLVDLARSCKMSIWVKNRRWYGRERASQNLNE